MQVVTFPIDKIIPYENNPRKNEQAVEIVMKSIEEFGFQNPILVDKDGVIIAGHTRYRASKRLGLTEVPVIVAENLTEEQAKAFRIMDNKSNEFAEWDVNKLLAELEDLADISYDLDLTGFSDKEIEELMGELEEELGIDEDEVELKDKGNTVFELVVELDNEYDQEELFSRLTQEGYKCRLLTL